MERKIKTFTFNGFGFPIQLIDAPMKKIDDEWVVDINMKELERAVFKRLISKPSPLTGKELRFLRRSLELSEIAFSEKLGLPENTIKRWEDGNLKIEPIQETYIRISLFESFFESTKALGIEKLVREITPQKLILSSPEDGIFSVDSKDLKEAG